MKNVICIVSFFLLNFSLLSQTKEVDSLLQIAKTATSVEKQVVSYANASWALIDVDLAKAISYNDSAFNISKRNNYKQGVIDSYYKYSVLNRALGDYEKALDYLNKYEGFIKEDTLKLAGVAFQKGVLNCIKGDNVEGLNNYHKALENYESLNNKRGLGITYNAIGIAYSNMKRYDESISNYEKSCEILIALDDIDALASTYTNLANVYDYQNQHDKALDYFQKSIELSIKTSNIRRIAHNKQNIASIYKEQKKYSKALTFSLEAYNILKENNYKGELTQSAGNLGEIYMLMGRYKKSEQVLKQQLDSIKGTIEAKSKVYFGLYKLYEVSNRPKEALEYHKAYKKLKDSIINEKGLKDLNQLQVKFDIEKKDKEIIEQQLSLNQQESEIRQKNSQLIYMSGIALFLLIAGLLIWLIFQQKQKRKSQELLTLKREYQIKSLESLIEGEEKERFRIAKELHDGVNGDLSAIKFKLSSLLEMNNKVIKEAITMIDSSCEQVRAISHNLVPPSLENFNLVEATENYCANLDAINAEQITFLHIGSDLQISKKTEVNIFRIIQELVSNAIKHAEASEINVQISNRDDEIQITVEDNGKGFDSNIETEGIGLSNIQSRVDYLNAVLDVISNENGTSYTIDIDLRTLNEN